jgi:hypothetical protein
MRRKWIFFAPLAILGVLAFMALGGVVVRELWNWLLPPLFGWRAITFAQALGLLVLCRILFGGVAGRGHGGRGYMRRRMAERMGERFEAMTPEERERFRQGMRSRCGFGPEPGESKPPASGL